MTDRVASLEQKSEVLSAQLAAQAIEAKRQRERVANIEGSRSWRVLAPVRLVADRFKSLFSPHEANSLGAATALVTVGTNCRTADALRQDRSLWAVASWTEFFGDYEGIEAKPPFDRRVGLRKNPIVSTAALVDMSVRDAGIRFAPDLAFP